MDFHFVHCESACLVGTQDGHASHIFDSSQTGNCDRVGGVRRGEGKGLRGGGSEKFEERGKGVGGILRPFLQSSDIRDEVRCREKGHEKMREECNQRVKKKKWRVK